MDAYLICELVDKNQALEVDDFAQTIKENQQFMKIFHFKFFIYLNKHLSQGSIKLSHWHTSNII
jgi:hypothetical protein